jgi:muramoyltetrapeptide carboxypeptidase LdcA involved in peptidoglycan recycling
VTGVQTCALPICLNIPVLANFPAGHIKDNWALPLGSRVRIDAGARSVHFLESAVR